MKVLLGAIAVFVGAALFAASLGVLLYTIDPPVIYKEICTKV